jgi:heme exporter protein B
MSGRPRARVPHQILAVIRKDLLIEWRSLSRVSGLFVFAVAILLLAAFSASSIEVMRRIAGGTLWLGLLLASTRSLDQSFAVEMEEGAMEGMVLWPVDPVAIYYGKALANTLVLVLVAFALTPLMIGVYDAPIKGDLKAYALTMVLGSGAIAAPGTLYALITSQARGASVLLPLLLLPLVMPALLAAARATSVLIEGDPMGQAPGWVGLLVAFNAIHWALSGLLFARIVENP